MNAVEFEILKYCYNLPYGSVVFVDDICRALPSYDCYLISDAIENLSRFGYLGTIYKGETYLTYKGHNYVEKSLDNQSAHIADAQGNPRFEKSALYQLLRDHAEWLIALVALILGLILGVNS